jgi:hypothetical protein
MARARMPTVDIYSGPMRGAIELLCGTLSPTEKCPVPTLHRVRLVWPLSQEAMLARPQIEILGDTEKILTERVGRLASVVHPSESRASLRPARAIGKGAHIVEISVMVGLTPFPPRSSIPFKGIGVLREPRNVL